MAEDTCYTYLSEPLLQNMSSSSLTSDGVGVPAKVDCSTYSNLWLMPVATESPKRSCHSVAGMNLKSTVPNLEELVDLQAPERELHYSATLS